MSNTPDTIEQDVLHAFSIEPNLDSDTLINYLERYPQFREALIDLSIELLTTSQYAQVSTEVIPGDSAQSAWSKFQSLLSPTDPAAASQKVVINPLVSLDSESFRQLAKELNITSLFLTRLRDRVIQASTIPERFIAQVADAVGTSIEIFSAALSAPPSISVVPQRFKAEGKPSVGKQITFDEAIDSSGLSEAQMSDLRSLKE